MPAALEWLSATDAARAIAEGAISSEQLVEACLARIRDAEPEVQAWHFLDPEHALTQARARDADRTRGPADRPAARRAGRHQGHHRHRPTCRPRTARCCTPGRTPDARRDRGRDAARGGRGDPRQDRHHRVRLFRARQDAQSAQSRAHARRLVDRARRRRSPRAWCRSRSARQTNGSVIRPGGILRRLRLQADARPDPAPRHPQALAHARSRRSVRAHARGHRAARRAAGRARRARSRHAPARAHPVRAHRGRGAAAAAEAGVREDAGLGARRRGNAARPSPSWSRRSARNARKCELPESLREAWDWHRTIMEAEMAANLDLRMGKGARPALGAAARAARARARGEGDRLSEGARPHAASCTRASTSCSQRFDAIADTVRPGHGARRAFRRPAIRPSARSGRCAACRR